jgi:hypothetical protein
MSLATSWRRPNRGRRSVNDQSHLGGTDHGIRTHDEGGAKLGRYIVLLLVIRMVNCGAATAERLLERIAAGDPCGAHDD